MTFTILFNTINYTFWITRFYQLTFVLYDKIKKEPATETNPQQALGFILYMICPFVINISGVHLHTLPTKINIVSLITKKITGN